MNHDGSLSDFLSSVPPALTLALVRLAPSIALSRAALQISSWSPDAYPSWLALAAWWAACLLLDKLLRRFLPFVLLGLYAYVQSRQKQAKALEPPTTEQALRNVIADLTIIQSLFPAPSLPSIPLFSLLRATLILYAPYVLLSLFVPFRVVLAIAGSIILTWRAPWAIVLRTTVWRSAWFRWSIYKSWAFLTGQPLPPRVMSSQPSINSHSPVQSLRFLFTIYENQRWWMGLDWTAALLPGERPSWCSASQQPLPPPNAFTLPENTTTYLPDGKGGRLKRTAIWKWEEPEWRVVVHNGNGLSRVERPLPTLKDENTSGSRLLKAAGKLREPSISSSGGDSSNGDASSQDLKEIDEEPLTDPDGWVYGDNKWEAQSNKGGMGKYTRYRKWTRVAVVFEEVESVPPGDMGIQKESQDPPLVKESSTPVPEGVISTSSSPTESLLKQRLRTALNKDKGSDP